MKTILVRAALACAVLALASATAIAGGVIPSVPVGLEGDPGSIIIAKGTTDANGNVTFRDLKPGNYVIVIRGKSLVATMDKLHPLIPEKESGGASLSIGGGLFGGGSGHSGNEDGHPDTGHGSHDASGGLGLGLNIPLGHSDPGPDRPGIVGTVANWLYLGLSLPSGGGGISGNRMKLEIPYCRDGGGQDIRIGFTIPTESKADANSEEPSVVGISLGASW
jgi:hypothetical protein